MDQSESREKNVGTNILQSRNLVQLHFGSSNSQCNILELCLILFEIT